MLESVHIQGFKGFKDTHIGPLRKVNLILGGQNVGKTSLLEAIHFVTWAPDFYPGSRFRDLVDKDGRRYTKSVFGKDFKALEARSTFEGGSIRVQQYNDADLGESNVVSLLGGARTADFALKAWALRGWASNPGSQAVALPLFVPTQKIQLDLFGQLVLGRKRKDLIDLLKVVEDRLEDLQQATIEDDQRIMADLKGLPIAIETSHLGHGFNRLLFIFSTLLTSESKLALIDEVENGIHYTALPVVMKGIQTVTSKRGVQTLMTTHSWDCLRAACEVFAETPDDFQLIRLEREGDNVRAVCIPGEYAVEMVRDDMEVR